MPSRIQWLYKEFGLASVVTTGRDAWLIILSRTCRMLAYGAASTFIALFFSALEFSETRIGLFFTFTMLGDVLLTIGLTLVADRLGRRKTLLLGSGMMMVSGLAFVYAENYWLLLGAAVVGVISVSGGDFGPFRAIEESMLSELTTPETRSDVMSWYVTTASFGSAIGTESGGRAIEMLKSKSSSELNAYHSVFALYVVMGLINAICVFCLSERTEIKPAAIGEEEEILLEENGSNEREETPVLEKATKFTQISKSTRSVMYKLWPLLIVDTMADGMVSLPLTTFFMERKFSVTASALGDIASISYFLAAISTIFAGPLANHIGLVNTMVFTHVPSSLAVLLFPLPPTFALTVLLFFIRIGLNNMDQAPRAAFIAAVVKPSERTAINGITSTLRTLSGTAGPTITGVLAGSDRFWIAFVAAGSLRLAYDFGLWALFVNMELYKHESS